MSETTIDAANVRMVFTRGDDYPGETAPLYRHISTAASTISGDGLMTTSMEPTTAIKIWTIRDGRGHNNMPTKEELLEFLGGEN